MQTHLDIPTIIFLQDLINNFVQKEGLPSSENSARLTKSDFLVLAIDHFAAQAPKLCMRTVMYPQA